MALEFYLIVAYRKFKLSKGKLRTLSAGQIAKLRRKARVHFTPEQSESLTAVQDIFHIERSIKDKRKLFIIGYQKFIDYDMSTKTGKVYNHDLNCTIV